ncbi:MAG: hypothetical protein ABSC06_34745 [Rhodopila sp.]|jgi:hypothetical protein
MVKFPRRPNEIPAQQQLDTDLELQRLFENLVRGGPAAVGYACCALLDHLGISADALGYLAGWRTADLSSGWRFDAPVPRRKPAARPHLRLVPTSPASELET